MRGRWRLLAFLTAVGIASGLVGGGDDSWQKTHIVRVGQSVSCATGLIGTVGTAQGGLMGSRHDPLARDVAAPSCSTLKGIGSDVDFTRGWAALLAEHKAEITTSTRPRVGGTTVLRADHSNTVAIIHAAFAGLDPDYAVCVAERESGLNPYAVGTEGEIGIAQFHPAGKLPGFLMWLGVPYGHPLMWDGKRQITYWAMDVELNGWEAYHGARYC